MNCFDENDWESESDRWGRYDPYAPLGRAEKPEQPRYWISIALVALFFMAVVIIILKYD